MTNVIVGWSRNCALLDLLKLLPAPDPAALVGFPDLGNLDFTSLYFLSFIDPDSCSSFYSEQLFQFNDPSRDLPNISCTRFTLSLRNLRDGETEATP